MKIVFPPLPCYSLVGFPCGGVSLPGQNIKSLHRLMQFAFGVDLREQLDSNRKLFLITKLLAQVPSMHRRSRSWRTAAADELQTSPGNRPWLFSGTYKSEETGQPPGQTILSWWNLSPLGHTFWLGSRKFIRIHGAKKEGKAE